jgi:hypothetical protein
MNPWPTKKLGEKEDLEYKSQFDGSDKAWLKLIKTAVAMANKNGGVIRYKKILTDISSLDSANMDNKINSYISPKLRGIISKNKKSEIDIIIPNSQLKPHIFIRRGTYKNKDGNEVVEFYEGQIWIRHSSKNELFDKNDFDVLVQEQIKKIMERMYIIAAQYPSSILEQSENGIPLKINPTKDKKKGLPVYIEKEKIDPNTAYPYQAKDLAKILDRSNAYVIQLLKVLRLKDDPKYNYNYKDSSGRIILRKYNEECLNYLRKFLIKNPNFNPWHDKS